MLTKTQIEYLVLGLVYNAAREFQRQEWEKNGRLHNVAWERTVQDAVNQLDSFLTWCECSGQVDEWIRHQGFSW